MNFFLFPFLFFLFFFFFFSFNSYVHAFGPHGHKAILTVAWMHLPSHHRDVIVETLGDFLLKHRLLDAATFADVLAENDPAERTLHFVNPSASAYDNCAYSAFSPYQNCQGGRCLTASLVVFARQAMCEPSNSRSDRANGLVHLIHLLGDVHQPFHIGAAYRGGNDAEVTFDGLRTNLHQVWDRHMIEKSIRQDHKGSFSAFAQELDRELYSENEQTKQPNYPRQDWVSCFDDSQPGEESSNSSALLLKRFQKCVELWEIETNHIQCTSGIWTNWDAGHDLGLMYHNDYVKLVKLQLMKAIYRLKHFLLLWLTKCRVEDPERVHHIVRQGMLGLDGSESLSTTSTTTPLFYDSRKSTVIQSAPLPVHSTSPPQKPQNRNNYGFFGNIFSYFNFGRASY